MSARIHIGCEGVAEQYATLEGTAEMHLDDLHRLVVIARDRGAPGRARIENDGESLTVVWTEEET